MFSKFERIIAYRYLRSPRQEGFVSVIAWFSFLGITLGVATLIIVMSVMNGFREELLGKIIGLNGHISIASDTSPLDDYTSLATQAKNISGVKYAIPIIDRQAMIMVRSQARGALIHGVDPQDIKTWPLVAKNIKAGNLDDFGTPDERGVLRENLIVGKRLAEKLGLYVGDRLSLISPDGNSTAFGTLPRQKTFRVAAIFEMGLFQYDDSLIFMPLSAAQTFFKMEKSVSHIDLFLDNLNDIAEKTFLLHTLLGEKYHIYDWQRSNNHVFQAVEIERNVMFVILTLIILIAAFNIISSLIMLVKDKNRDIAILRTMGATRASIQKIFFLVGSTIGLIGTFMGVVVGLIFTLNIEKIRQFLQSLSGAELFRAEIYFLTQLPAKVDWTEVSLIITIALTLSFLATIYPSWRAARLDPVEALRQ